MCVLRLFTGTKNIAGTRPRKFLSWAGKILLDDALSAQSLLFLLLTDSARPHTCASPGGARRLIKKKSRGSTHAVAPMPNERAGVHGSAGHIGCDAHTPKINERRK